MGVFSDTGRRRRRTTVRAQFVVGLIACVFTAFGVREVAGRALANDAPYCRTYAMAWYGCTARGECLPSFYPIASGRAELLRCSGSGRCALSSYLEWDLGDDRGFTWRMAPEARPTPATPPAPKRSAEARVASRSR